MVICECKECREPEAEKKWGAMIPELLDMLPATDVDDTPLAFDMIRSEFQRIAEHLDSLPAEYRLPITDAEALQLAKSEVLAW